MRFARLFFVRHRVLPRFSRKERLTEVRGEIVKDILAQDRRSAAHWRQDRWQWPMTPA